MEAFVACNPLRTSRRSLSTNKCTQKRRTLTFAKARRPNKPPPKSDGFAGMAAGPSAPSKTPKSISSNNTAAETAADETQKADESAPASSDNSVSGKTVTSALGQRREPKTPMQITKKTRQDFIAEGIVDEGDEADSQFVEEDIRFGIDDLKDPFKEQDAEQAKQRAEEQMDGIQSTVGKAVDVSGDGGVAKCVIRPGQGDVVQNGATVKVQYKGSLQDGSVFDDSSTRGDFEFMLGTGTVIKGWEAGVSTMRQGEIAQFTIQPSYAYGRRGMPPVIPSNAVLTFEIELVSFGAGKGEEIKKVADYNPDVA